MKHEGLEFYRCFSCARVISAWDIAKQVKEHESYQCPRCDGVRLRPANLTFIEKVVQLIKHPAIWKWKGVTLNV